MMKAAVLEAPNRLAYQGDRGSGTGRRTAGAGPGRGSRGVRLGPAAVRARHRLPLPAGARARVLRGGRAGAGGQPVRAGDKVAVFPLLPRSRRPVHPDRRVGAGRGLRLLRLPARRRHGRAAVGARGQPGAGARARAAGARRGGGAGRGGAARGAQAAGAGQRHGAGDRGRTDRRAGRAVAAHPRLDQGDRGRCGRPQAGRDARARVRDARRRGARRGGRGEGARPAAWVWTPRWRPAGCRRPSCSASTGDRAAGPGADAGRPQGRRDHPARADLFADPPRADRARHLELEDHPGRAQRVGHGRRAHRRGHPGGGPADQPHAAAGGGAAGAGRHGRASDLVEQGRVRGGRTRPGPRMFRRGGGRREGCAVFRRPPVSRSSW